MGRHCFDDHSSWTADIFLEGGAQYGRQRQCRVFAGGIWFASRGVVCDHSLPASLLAFHTGVALGIMQILEKLADEHFQSSMPKFQEFVAGMMTPVAWPAQESGFTVEEVFFNGSFQIGGDPGFAN